MSFDVKDSKLIDVFVCNTDNCNYFKLVENGNLEELYELIENDGGEISEGNQICPDCQQNSLEYENYPI